MAPRSPLTGPRTGTRRGGYPPGQPALTLGRRTAIGTAGHALRDTTASALAAPVLRQIADVAAGRLGEVNDVVLGNCLGPGGNVARVSALEAGLGEGVPGVTVDRQCGSGLEAVMQAAVRVRGGDAHLLLAGGVESASTAPWRFWPPEPGAADPDRPGARYTRAPFTPDGWPDPDMGSAADALAVERGISPGEPGRLRGTLACAHRGRPGGRNVRRRDRPDQGRRARRPAAGRARRRPARAAPARVRTVRHRHRRQFLRHLRRRRGGRRDDAEAARAAGLDHLVVLGAAVAAADPTLPGAAPAPAVRRLLDRTEVGGIRLALEDIGAVEITEAFASIVLAVADELRIDLDRICAEGGAIGLGHPWGASGAILLLRLASRMRAPDGPAFGLAACAIGGGQGIAMLLGHPDRAAS